MSDFMKKSVQREPGFSMRTDGQTWQSF